MKHQITCLVVDDEPLARKGLSELIKNYPNLVLQDTLKSAEEAKEHLKHKPVDLIFLDVQMAGINGIELIQELDLLSPLVIFITAHPEFAVESYNLNAVDYLLKPVSPERFKTSIDKALDAMLKPEANKGNINFFFAKSSGRFVRINMEDITHVSGMQNYVRLHLKNEKPLILHTSMKNIIHKLPPSSFVMVHKSFLVNFASIKSVTGNRVFLSDNISLPLSRNYKAGVLKMINKLN